MKRFNRSFAVIAILSGLGLAACQQKAAETPAAPVAAESTTPAAAVVYTCSMHPEIQQATPGKCPTCGMDLVQKQ